MHVTAASDANLNAAAKLQLRGDSAALRGSAGVSFASSDVAVEAVTAGDLELRAGSSASIRAISDFPIGQHSTNETATNANVMSFHGDIEMESINTEVSSPQATVVESTSGSITTHGNAATMSAYAANLRADTTDVEVTGANLVSVRAGQSALVVAQGSANVSSAHGAIDIRANTTLTVESTSKATLSSGA